MFNSPVRRLPWGALKVYLRSLPLGRRRERNHPKYPRAHSLSDPLDDSAFPGRVFAFKDNNDPYAGTFHPEL